MWQKWWSRLGEGEEGGREGGWRAEAGLSWQSSCELAPPEGCSLPYQPLLLVGNIIWSKLSNTLALVGSNEKAELKIDLLPFDAGEKVKR